MGNSELGRHGSENKRQHAQRPSQLGAGSRGEDNDMSVGWGECREVKSSETDGSRSEGRSAWALELGGSGVVQDGKVLLLGASELNPPPRRRSRSPSTVPTYSPSHTSHTHASP